MSSSFAMLFLACCLSFDQVVYVVMLLQGQPVVSQSRQMLKVLAIYGVPQGMYKNNLELFIRV